MTNKQNQTSEPLEEENICPETNILLDEDLDKVTGGAIQTANKRKKITVITD